MRNLTKINWILIAGIATAALAVMSILEEIGPIVIE